MSNRAYFREYRRKRRDETRLYIDGYKRDRGCALCPPGTVWPAVALQLDHPPGSEKVGSVGVLVSHDKYKQAIEEAKKCHVLCANHHHIVTWGRREAPELPPVAHAARVAPMPKRCSICADPNRNEWVARRHMEGHSASKMEAMSRDMGSPIKRETIGRHLKLCVGVPKASPKEVKAVAEKVAKAIAPVQEGEDVAVLVQREVVAKLKDGQARVTVQHGLQAQQLLDRRAERAKDRELAVTLARLLHSPAPPSTAITARPVEVIEGQATEVSN